MRLAFYFVHTDAGGRARMCVRALARSLVRYARGFIALQWLAPGKMRTDLQQRGGGINGRLPDQCGFPGVLMRQYKAASGTRGAIRHRQCSAYGAQFTGQSKLASPFVLVEFIRRDL